MSSRFPPKTVSRPHMLQDGDDREFRRSIYRFVQAAGRLGDCREGFARELGLTGNQFIVLMSVAYQQDQQGVGIAAIAANVGLASTHATTEVGRLVRLGLLHKAPSPIDRRSVLVSLTKAGRKEVERISSFVQVINDLLFEDITSKEIEALRLVSEKLVRNSERALAEMRLFSRRHEFSVSQEPAE